MFRHFLFLVLLLLPVISAQAAEQAIPEEQVVQFWGWFQEAEARWHRAEEFTDADYEAMTTKLKTFHPSVSLVPDAPMAQDGRKQFILTAYGDASAVAVIEKLHEHAPISDRWKISKYLPRTDLKVISEVLSSEGNFRLENLRFILIPDGKTVGIDVFAVDVNPTFVEATGVQHFFFRDLVEAVLQELLGEEDFVKQVAYFDISDRYGLDFDRSLPIETLPSAFDAHFSR